MVSSDKKSKRQFLHLKVAVVELRKTGKTYSEIREVHPVPKGTLSDWLRDVKIPKKDRKEMEKRGYDKWKLANSIFIQKRVQDAFEKRQKFEDEARKEIGKINKDELKIVGSMLYWAEGSKKNRNHLYFANSDPEIIKIIMKFFREICVMPDKKIKCRVHIYPKMDYKKTLNFWSKLTRLPIQNFYKPQTQISRASKGKRKTNTLPFGTLHIDIAHTETVSKVRGWIKGISEQI